MHNLMPRLHRTVTLRIQTWLVAGTLVGGLLHPLAGQHTPGDEFHRRLAAGEFTRAWDMAQEFQGAERDQALSELASAQASSAAIGGAIRSAGAIQNPAEQHAAFGALSQAGDAARAGGAGGISAADFSELIQLIQETIEPPSWDEENASIRPYVAGVYVDAAGLLQRVRSDADFDWRAGAVSADEGLSLAAPARNGLRKISLPRLAAQLREQDLRGRRDAATRHLGGIYRLEYLAIDRNSGEIILAGQAGPVVQNAAGLWVNAANGQAVLLVDDLVECLRNALAGSTAFGCSIDPRPDNLAATSRYLAETKLTNKPFREGLLKALGLQDIHIFGIDPTSHAAQVLVEADYRMKCIGLGVEPSIPEVPAYWDRIEIDDQQLPPALGMARWWFTVNYDAVVANADKTRFALRGPGVKVLSEDEMLGRDGARIQTGAASGPNKSYADDFTRHFARMAEAKPVFAELRNVFDLALLSALIVQAMPREQLAELLGYLAPASGDNADQLVYQPARLPAPLAVASVMNHRYYESSATGRRQRHMVVAVGGGVQFEAKSALQKLATDQRGELEQVFAEPNTVPAGWYWDQ